MDIRILRTLDFDEVRETFLDGKDESETSTKYALRNLRRANRQFDGRWAEVKLHAGLLRNILLPSHGGRGEQTLVPAEGSTVQEALERYRALDGYEETNPDCWRTIEKHRGRDFSLLLLSAAPVDRPGYGKLDGSGEHLVHLDGLHRLIAWGLDGRYEPGQLEEGEGPRAYVAGL